MKYSKFITLAICRTNVFGYYVNMYDQTEISLSKCEYVEHLKKKIRSKHIVSNKDWGRTEKQ